MAPTPVTGFARTAHRAIPDTGVPGRVDRRPSGTGPAHRQTRCRILASGVAPQASVHPARTMNAPDTDSVLNDQVLQAMAARGGVKTFPAQSVLINEEDESDSIFILLKGKVKIYGAGPNGREVVYTTLGAGEYFGEMTLDGGPRSASVMTLEPTTCVVVPGANVRDFLGSHPDFALHLIRKLIALVRRSTDTVKSLALDDVYTRIKKLLLEMAVTEGERQVVPDRLTQQDIADRVGSSREMVSRIFKQLTIGGYVATEGKRIVLLKKLPARW